ncbi:hypothetical protein [Nocardioides alcanivorans]|uniref:hypothetical protein n=1 Tax=Nocardioides alcanivorans TaxID=2897352 RepID=UPI001F41552B|nr:hypothetical protein [Nocardioides alcanivorans]
MADEPGGWELHRAVKKMGEDLTTGLAQLNQRLDRLVSTDAFNAEQRRVDDRLKDLADDIAGERAARVAAQETERSERKEGDKAQQATLDKLTTNLRWVAASIILPIALFVATLLMNMRGES